VTDTRVRILAAAQRLYLEEGVEGVTMRRVAERVGVTPTALYRHFESKDSLVEAVITEGYRVFGGYLHRSLAGATPAERLRLSGQAYLDFALQQSEMYRTIFMTPLRGSTGYLEPRDPRKDATFRFLVDRVGECIRSGDLAPDDPEEVAVTIWASVHGLVALYIAGAFTGGEVAFRSIYEASMGRLFRGLLP
jgi:AcrR family transcriptional regulator